MAEPMAEPSGNDVRRVAVLYVSLTGNTKHVAELLRDALAQEHRMDAVAVDVTDAAGSDAAAAAALASCDAFGFGGPAIGWREPTKLRQVIQRVPEGLVRGKPAFVFGTAGGHEGRLLSNTAGQLAGKGAVVVASLIVYAPPNWTRVAPPQGSAFQWGSAERRKPAAFARALAPLLRARQPVPARVRPGLAGVALSWWATDERIRDFVGAVEVDAGLCARCGLCARRCPSGALDIEEGGGVPRWERSRCTGCCRCVNACPKNCINTRATRGKQQYQCRPDVFADGDFAFKVLKPQKKR
eukprot:m51a1_g14453 hypothetical protein (298) ;mRNA; r:629596-630577